MKLFFYFKLAIFALLFMLPNHLFCQVFLEEKFATIEFFLTTQGAHYEKKSLPNDDKLLTHLVYNEQGQLEAFKEILFSKNNGSDYICNKESAYVRYSEKLANELSAEFDVKGYEETNLMTKDFYSVFKSSDLDKDSKKHYICTSIVEIDSQGLWICVEYFSNTDEFIEKK